MYVTDLSLTLKAEVVNVSAILTATLTPYLSFSDLPLHCFPFVLQVGEVLLRVAVRTLGRHGEQLVTLVHQLPIQLLLRLEGRTQLLPDTMTQGESFRQTGLIAALVLNNDVRVCSMMNLSVHFIFYVLAQKW